MNWFLSPSLVIGLLKYFSLLLNTSVAYSRNSKFHIFQIKNKPKIPVLMKKNPTISSRSFVCWKWEGKSCLQLCLKHWIILIWKLSCRSSDVTDLYQQYLNVMLLTTCTACYHCLSNSFSFSFSSCEFLHNKHTKLWNWMSKAIKVIPQPVWKHNWL